MTSSAPSLESRDERRRQRAAARAAARAIPPIRHDAFTHLSLEELRTYRQILITEEDTISYWRRLLHARIEVVRAGEKLTVIDPAHLRSIRSSDRRHQGRRHLVAVVHGNDLPELPDLPDLTDLWATNPHSEAERAVHAEELDTVEEQISIYRNALHVRLDSATAELIARYHEDPSSCLIALPLPPDER